jgi:aryl-alcohol dehydrogenase-like predicted oxidoreductase
MEYRYLGKSGLKVSEMCLGTMTFGREADKETSFAMMDRFVAGGGNFLDTADVYSQGLSEQIVGGWLKTKQRDSIILATKVRFRMGDGPNDVGLSRKHIFSAVDESLERLGTDYIDLYQMHCWDSPTPLEESLEAMNDLVRNGKVRYIGVSNFTGWQLQKAIDLSRQKGWAVFVSLQPLYNLLDRTIEWELLPVCEAEGLGVIPWSPLRGGWLTGKYQRGQDAPMKGTRIEIAEKYGWSESWSHYNVERTWRILDELVLAAQQLNRPPSQIALRWLLQRLNVTAPIIGARNLTQLEDNMGASGWLLAEETMQRLTDVSNLTPPYPYDFILNAQR